MVSDALVGMVIANLVATIFQGILVAYHYGRNTQKLDDACRRLDRVEKKINGRG